MLRAIMQAAAFVAVCLITGYVFKKSGLNFYVGLVAGISLQYILNYLFQYVVDLIVAIKSKQLENERIKEFTMQGIEVECPCSRKITDFVPIRLNTANKYKCKECQKVISVFITPSTALTTEPILDTDTTKIDIIANELKRQ